MFSLDTFLLCLLIISTFTSLTTEAVKNLLWSWNKSYQSNIIAGAASIVLSLITGVAYVIINGIAFTDEIVMCIIALVFLSWLCAMVGYDKVIQAASQFTKSKKE